MNVDISRYGFDILQIETKSVCNMKCDFCPYPRRIDKGDTLEEDKIYEILDSLDNQESLKYVCFSQFNEPLLDDRVYKYINHCKEKSLPVLLITNGMLFDDVGVIDNLIKAAPDMVKISLHTLNDELFAASRKTNKSYSKYIKGIYSFLSAINGKNVAVTLDVACNFQSGIKGKLRSILGLEVGDASVYNEIGDLEGDMVSFLNDLEKHDSVFKSMPSRLTTYLNKLNDNYIEQDSYSISNNIDIKVKRFHHGNKTADYYPLDTGVGCNTSILGILASGDVVPCCLMYGNESSFGSIYEQSLGDILENGAQWLDGIRNGKSLPDLCKRCMGAPTRRGVIFRKLLVQIKDKIPGI